MSLALHSTDTRELFDRYVVPNYGRFPLRLSRGQGSRVWDEDGNEYLDFGAGIAVCSIGHCHPRVIDVMTKQLGTLVHTSNLYYTRPQGLLAKRLVSWSASRAKSFSATAARKPTKRSTSSRASLATTASRLRRRTRPARKSRRNKIASASSRLMVPFMAAPSPVSPRRVRKK